MNYKHLFLLSWLVAISFWACTKTEPFEVVPPNRMTEYKVVNLQDTVIYGAIDNENNTVTVYVPFYLSMSVIEPEIKVEEGATLETEAMPVELDNTTQTYTVRGADGSERTYQLNIVQQNIPSLSLAWSRTQPNAAPGNELYQKTVNGVPAFATLYGNFQSTSTATLSIAMINRSTGDTLKPSLSGVTIIPTTGNLPFPGDYRLSTVIIPYEADSGYYDVEVGFLGHKEKVPEPLHVEYYQPVFAPLWSAKVSTPGGEISFLPHASPMQYVFVEPKSAKAVLDGKTYDFAVQASSTRQNLVLKVPNDFPVGDYASVPFSFQFGNWPAIEVNVPLTINAQ